jgi:Flp pilus assembly secretin CpaC
MRIERLRQCVLGAVLLLAMLPIARASNEAITLGVGGGSELTIARPFDTILVGNPDVVEVHPRNDRTVLLKALSIGASNIVFLDARSIVIDNIRVIVSDART